MSVVAWLSLCLELKLTVYSAMKSAPYACGVVAAAENAPIPPILTGCTVTKLDGRRDESSRTVQGHRKQRQ